MIQKIKNYFIGLYIRFCGRPSRLKKAIKKAKALNKKTGKRYRVFFFGYRYHVWDRWDIKERKRIGLFHTHLKVGNDFDSICFYDTSNPDKLCS
jgi:hypothetical protein